MIAVDRDVAPCSAFIVTASPGHGVAISTGADVAILSAGVTLVQGNLRGIVRTRDLSGAAMRRRTADFTRAAKLPSRSTRTPGG